jgi:outer membrane protein assembly factor BamB
MAPACNAADWPQFRGPNRDGKSLETGLLKKWPDGGPMLLWSVEGLGAGYSSAAIADGLVYTTGKNGPDGYIFCFDLTGKQRWKVVYGPEWTKSYPATRTTPTVNDGKLYVFSGMGVVYCLDARTGAKIWSRDVFGEFEGQFPRWGMSECLLVDGSKVIATPGGKKASIVALDKNDGRVLWACEGLTEGSAYCNPIAIEYEGTRMIVTMTRDSVVAIEAETGKLLWRDPFDDYHIDRKRVVNANAPLYFDGQIYTASGYDNGGAMVQLPADATKIERKWVDRTLDVHHGGVVLVDGYIYGANFKSMTRGNWACLQWNTGKAMYDTTWQGNKGSTIYADGMLYCYTETTGDVGLAEATPEGFNVVSSFKITAGKGKHWAHPSISDGLLYIRHGDVMMVYDISAGAR